MMLVASSAHDTLLKHQTRLHGEALPFWSRSPSFLGSSLAISHSTAPPGNQTLSRIQLVVLTKKIAGSEGAMNTKKECGLHVVTKVKKKLPPGRASPCRPAPDHTTKSPYVGSNTLPRFPDEHQIHDSNGLAEMKAACEPVAHVINLAKASD
ncbi:hypothetical protein VNO77_15616 [Canavalia gladiata]|uniref:Uncharacterized protein n=1 Tax=Canavalia gladiata TaxID=3824 RepID=A0AAN9QVY1_CANGL